VELRGDEPSRDILILQLPEIDWATEYSDLILAIKIVVLSEAIAHINSYGSGHTDAIATEDSTAAATFLAGECSWVYHNCSTRFSDGFRYGFGAEVGISTQKMPPRGPVGLAGDLQISTTAMVTLLLHTWQMLNLLLIRIWVETNRRGLPHQGFKKCLKLC